MEKIFFRIVPFIEYDDGSIEEYSIYKEKQEGELDMKKKENEDNLELLPSYTNMTERQVKKYLRDKTWQHFSDWMRGQTCPVLRGGKQGYYRHDVERYMEGILEGRPTYFD